MNALQAKELEGLPIEQERFEIQDINAANWAVRKIAAAQAAIREREILAQAEIDRIKQWLVGETKELQQTIDFFTRLLEKYHRKQIKADPKNKTIKLPYGTLKMRAQQPQYQRDDAAIKEWARVNRPE
ncbi:host-nuclease inhibitor Gam family protein, partial [Desulfofalx alkaliphila]|uniref:host-nuclease inhibitor Gam family protein n=1 Tax=Desulfofalx alkaliphila TaxID=105483 RepID=UPI0004E1FE1B